MHNSPYSDLPTVPMPAMPGGSSRKRRRKPLIVVLIILGSAFLLCIGASVIGAIVTPPSPQVVLQPTRPALSLTQGSLPTQAPQPTPTPQIYPPKTQANLTALAHRGNADVLHTFDSETVGLTGACPQPKREVTVDPSITGQQLAEDLLAYFYGNHLDSPCSSVVFAYHTQAESNGDGYTAGRISFDVTDSSGQENVDPNATDLKYTLTLDIGGLLTSEQEFVVSY